MDFPKLFERLDRIHGLYPEFHYEAYKDDPDMFGGRFQEPLKTLDVVEHYRNYKKAFTKQTNDVPDLLIYLNFSMPMKITLDYLKLDTKPIYAISKHIAFRFFGSVETLMIYAHYKATGNHTARWSDTVDVVGVSVRKLHKWDIEIPSLVELENYDFNKTLAEINGTLDDSA